MRFLRCRLKYCILLYKRENNIINNNISNLKELIGLLNFGGNCTAFPLIQCNKVSFNVLYCTAFPLLQCNKVNLNVLYCTAFPNDCRKCNKIIIVNDLVILNAIKFFRYFTSFEMKIILFRTQTNLNKVEIPAKLYCT